MYNRAMISKPLVVLALLLGIWILNWSKLVLALDLIWEKVLFVLLAFLVVYAALRWTGWIIKKCVSFLDGYVDSLSLEVLVGGTVGLFLGIAGGFLCSQSLSLFRGWGNYLNIIVFLSCVFLGIKIGTRRAYDVVKLIPGINTVSRESVSAAGSCKVLDTSAIIDGRIYDVCVSRFLEGQLIVPTFVIEELQRIADSSDNIRRNKGRRGLELLSKMQKNPLVEIDIADITDIAVIEEKEVDAKLIRLCKQLDADIITNDYNLNKVAELQGIKVLNINELTNAVKMVVYPGEAMHVNVIKEGKEIGQGVGYLEDGTMVVVEDAQSQIGNELEVIVTSVFQTAAGRMVFTRKAVREDSQQPSYMPSGFPDVRGVNLYG